MINFKFDIEKLVQIVDFLLKRNNGIMNYTKLIKILYIADKEFFKSHHINITTDNYCTMQNGPVLSKLYDLIKGEHKNNEEKYFWKSFFQTVGYHLQLIAQNQMKYEKLSDAEIEVLTRLNKEFKRKDFNYMIKY